MQKKKRNYEKPKLEPLKMIEVGAALCCKSSAVLCPNNATRQAKGQRVSTAS